MLTGYPFIQIVFCVTARKHHQTLPFSRLECSTPSLGRKWPAFRAYDLVSPNMAGKGGNSRHTATIFLEPRAAHRGSRCAIQGTLQQHQRHSVGKQWLAEQPRPLAFKGDLPQLRIDLSDPCNVSLGPSSVLRMRGSGPCLALRRPWSGRPAAMQPTPGLSFEGRLLAGGAPAGFSEAALARPIATKTRCPAGFYQR